MLEILEQPAAQVIIGVAGLAIMIVIGAYVIGLARGGLQGRDTSPSDLLSNFREMHSQGELADEEFRTIKGMLGAQLRNEVKSDDESG